MARATELGSKQQPFEIVCFVAFASHVSAPKRESLGFGAAWALLPRVRGELDFQAIIFEILCSVSKKTDTVNTSYNIKYGSSSLAECRTRLNVAERKVWQVASVPRTRNKSSRGRTGESAVKTKPGLFYPQHTPNLKFRWKVLKMYTAEHKGIC